MSRPLRIRGLRIFAAADPETDAQPTEAFQLRLNEAYSTIEQRAETEGAEIYEGLKRFWTMRPFSKPAYARPLFVIDERLFHPAKMAQLLPVLEYSSAFHEMSFDATRSAHPAHP